MVLWEDLRSVKHLKEPNVDVFSGFVLRDVGVMVGGWQTWGTMNVV